jgi:hypothetical protein
MTDERDPQTPVEPTEPDTTPPVEEEPTGDDTAKPSEPQG